MGGRRRCQVVDGVLDSLAPRHDDGRDGERLSRGDGAPLARIGGVQTEEHVGRVAGRAGSEREAPIALLVHQLVAGGVGAQSVAPQLVRSLGLVHTHVEHDVRAGRPGEPVGGLGHHLGSGAREDVGIERTEAQLVPLVAGAVGRIRQPAVVVADRGAADGEVLGAGGLDVLIEQYLLLLAGLARRWELVVPVGGPAAVDGVALSLLSSRVVPPGAATGRDRHVGLLDARFHLFEQVVAEAGQ